MQAWSQEVWSFCQARCPSDKTSAWQVYAQKRTSASTFPLSISNILLTIYTQPMKVTQNAPHPLAKYVLTLAYICISSLQQQPNICRLSKTHMDIGRSDSEHRRVGERMGGEKRGSCLLLLSQPFDGNI